MELLALVWLGTPLWMWLTFLGLVLMLLALDLGVLNRGSDEIGISKSLRLSAFYITLGLAFGGWVWWQLGQEAAIAYVTGFVVEKSLAMDNVFVIAMIFTALAIPRAYQHRVLFWGILGVIVLRAIMIGFGAALVSEFSWVLYLFAAFLVFTGIQMWRSAGELYDVDNSRVLGLIRRHLPVTERLHGQRFFIREGGRTWITPLFVALLMVEFVDIIFAVDSVPAIFAITTDPFLVYTSNIFAILGLRALYFALAAVIDRFAYLKYALAVLLVFIGSKIFLADALGLGKFPPAASLGITVAILAAGVGWSLWKTRGSGKAPA
jgi:tellurite resistance protein TerC